jgi:hypothetical protein
MAHFFRIYNNQLSSLGEVNKIGFDTNNAYAIPDEYLDTQEFVVMRTCHGIGDWAVISAMPRLLKQKYPNCKVYVPSPKMLRSIFGEMLNMWGYGVYDCSNITLDIFKNNPYVDAFIDSYNGEIFHDHYRIYDLNNSKIPLVEQMLKFWQFNESEMLDSNPDIFFDDDEIKKGNSIIETYWNNNPYAYVSVSSTFGTTSDEQSLIDVIDNGLNWFYYGEQPIQDTSLNYLNNIVEVKPLQLSIREQMYLKSKAILNVGNETGMNLWSTRFSKTYILGNKRYGSNHGGVNEGKIRKDPFSSGNFVKNVIYV